MREILLALPFGLAVGVLLGLIGGGGSILAVPVLVYALGEPVKQATTESLLIVGVTALAGAVAAARAGRVRWRLGLAFAAAGAVGSLAGTALNRIVPSRWLLVGFGVLLVAAAAAMLRGRHAAARPGAGAASARVGVVGAATGALTGFFGVGGGFVVVPALALMVGLPTPVAVGTSLLVIALTSGVAFAAHLASGGIDIGLASAFAAAAIGGALLGTRLHGAVPEPQIRQAFAVVAGGLGAFLVVHNGVGV